MEIIQIRLDTENGTYICETYESTSIQISRRVQSLETLEGSQATFTKQSFTLPLQGELLKALGDITDPKSDFNIDIRKSIPGSILISGVTAYEGSYIITGANYNPNTKEKEVDLIFKGNESSIKSETNNVLLKELLADYTIPYNFTSITTSFAQSAGNTLADLGYLFVVVDLGQGFKGRTAPAPGTSINDFQNPINHDNFKPAINWKYILDAIEAELDLVIEYDTDITDLIESQVLYLHNNEKPYPELDTSPLNGTGEMGISTFKSVTTSISSFQKIDYDTKSVYSDDYFDLLNDNFTAPYQLSPTDGNAVKITARVRVLGDGSPNVGETDQIRVSVIMYKNGAQYAVIGEEEFQVVDNSPFDERVNIERTIAFNGTTGDTFDVRIAAIVATSTGAPATISQYNIEGGGTKFEVLQMPQVNPSSNMSVGDNVDPEITVWDCIKHIISQCNGIVENTLNGFNIKPWVKWVDEGADLILDDYGIDSTKDLQFIPTGVTGAKTIELKYAESEDFYSEQVRKKTGKNYGTQLIEDTGSDFATETFEIESPFAPWIPVPIRGTGTPIMQLIDEDGEIINDKMHVGYFNSDLNVGQIAVKDKSSSSVYFGFFPTVLNWLGVGFDAKDLNFGKSVSYFAATGYPDNTLYNRFWKRYIQESFSAQAMEVKASINLPKAIAQNLTLNERIFYNGYTLRFNALENYSINDKEPIDVEMVVRTTVENIDIAPFYPYDVISSIVQWKDSSNNNDLADASGQTPADVKASCIAYGFFYDSVNNIGIEQGKLIVT